MSTLSFFASLTKGVKAALSFFRGAAATEATPSEIISKARELGFSFRTQQALDVIGVLRGKIDTQRAIRTTPINEPLDPRFYNQMLGGLRNYSYEVLRRIRGVESGTTDNNYVTVSSNEPLSVQQILDTASAYTSGTCNPLFEEIVVDEMTVTNASKQSGL
jgi:hypothetical protein